MSPSDDVTCIGVTPYTPSAEVEKFKKEQAEYNRRAKDMHFGEIR